MNRSWWSLLALLAALPVAAQQGDVRARRVAPEVSIRLWVPAGTVEVRGWDHDSVEIRATTGTGTRFDGGGTAAAMKFSLENLRTNDTLLPSARLQVFVPRRARLWIKSTTATVDVRDVAGELDVLQVGGRTTVTDASGIVTVESIDGATRLLRVDGVVRLRGGSGSARVEDMSGTLDASLVSGNLLLSKNTRVEATAPGAPLRGRVETVSGKVWFLGSLGQGGELEVATHDGAVDLQLLGSRPPLVESTVAGATIPGVLRTGDAKVARYLIRSFKGAVNAAYFSGI